MKTGFFDSKKYRSLRHLGVGLILSVSSGAHPVPLSNESDLISTMIAAPDDYSSSSKISELFSSIFQRSPITENILEVRRREALEASAANWVPDPEENIFLQVILNNYDKLSSDSEREFFARANPAIDFKTRRPKPLASQKTQELYGIQLKGMNQDDYTRLRKFFVALRKSNPKFKFSDAQIHEFVMNILMKQKQEGDSSIRELVAELMNNIHSLNSSADLAQKTEALKEISIHLKSLHESLGGGGASASALAQFLNNAHDAAKDPSTLSAMYAGVASPQEEPLSALAGLDFKSPASVFSELGLKDLPKFQIEAPEALMDWGLSKGGGQLQAAVESTLIQDDSNPRSSLRRFTGTALAPASLNSNNSSETADKAPSLAPSLAPDLNRQSLSNATPNAGNSARQNSNPSTGSGHLSNGKSLHDEKYSHTQRQTVNRTPQLPSITPAPLTMSARNFTQPLSSTNPAPTNSSGNTAQPPSWAYEQARDMAEFLKIDKNTTDYESYVDNYAKYVHELYLAREREAEKKNSSGSASGAASGTYRASSGNSVSDPSGRTSGGGWTCQEQLETLFLSKFLNTVCGDFCTEFDGKAADIQEKIVHTLGFKKAFHELDDNEKGQLRSKALDIASKNPEVCEIVKKFDEHEDKLKKEYAKDPNEYEKQRGELFKQAILDVGEATLVAIKAATQDPPKIQVAAATQVPSETQVPVAIQEKPNQNKSSPDTQKPDTQKYSTPAPSISKAHSNKMPTSAPTPTPAAPSCPTQMTANDFLKKIGTPYREWYEENVPSSDDWTEKILDQIETNIIEKLFTSNSAENSNKSRFLFEGLRREDLDRLDLNAKKREIRNVVTANIHKKGYPILEDIYKKAGRCIPLELPNPSNQSQRDDFLFLAEALHLAAFKVLTNAEMIQIESNGCPRATKSDEKTTPWDSIDASARLFSSLSNIHIVVQREDLDFKDKNMSCSKFTNKIITRHSFAYLSSKADIGFSHAPMTELLNKCKHQVARIADNYAERFPIKPNKECDKECEHCMSKFNNTACKDCMSECEKEYKVHCMSAQSLFRYSENVLKIDPKSVSSMFMAEGGKSERRHTRQNR